MNILHDQVLNYYILTFNAVLPKQQPLQVYSTFIYVVYAVLFDVRAQN